MGFEADTISRARFSSLDRAICRWKIRARARLWRGAFDSNRLSKCAVNIDISDIAIERAKGLSLANARFVSADIVDIAFSGYDVITAIECLYYLSREECEAVLERISSERNGKILIISAPIIDERAHQKYFVHEEIMHLLRRHRIAVESFRNLYVREGHSRLANFARSVFLRAPLTDLTLDYLPDWMICQRCYVGRVSDSQ